MVRDRSARRDACQSKNLGSIIAVVNAAGGKVFEAEYDAWGSQTVTRNDIRLSRGYTGHEMLRTFGLIHMDGRVYDPVIGRFLSPDNYVQLPENSQSFNRYSYCINNPLKYTDPTGQLFGIDDVALFFAAASLYQSVMTAAVTGESVWKAAGISILSSAVSSGAGVACNAIGGLFGHSVGTFGKELLRAGAHGLASGVQNALTGKNFGVGFATGALASLSASGLQALGGDSYAVVGTSALMGGLTSWSLGGDFFDGAMTGLNIGLYNHTWVDGGELPEVTVTGKARSKLSSTLAAMAAARRADNASSIGIVYDPRALALGAIVGAFYIYEHRATIENGITQAYNSISTMATKTMECRPGYVYHLVARSNGMYPNVRGGKVHLKAGETWKIGETINGPGRYPQSYLNELNVDMVPHSGPMTNKYQLWIEEKRQLIKYASKYGRLPPGNKMFK